MKILVHPTEQDAVQATAKALLQQLKDKPVSVLGLATGGTMLPVYHALIVAYQCRDVSFSRCKSFNLDEYIGLSGEHPCSYRAYMNDVLFDHIDIDLANTHLPKGDAQDPESEASAYERMIDAVGGIDLQLLGLGHNGHIGFNEPSSSLTSQTRVKTLTQSTRDANLRFFDKMDDVPRFAITMGIGTILRARQCVLLATGQAKAEAVAQMIEGPVSSLCPASALQMHERATIIIDDAAASKLKLLDYYKHVHPAGVDQ